MTKVTVTQIRKYMANLNRMAGQFQGTFPSSEDVTITLKDAAQAYDKATVCLQAIRALQNGDSVTCVNLLKTTGFQFERKTQTQSYLTRNTLENIEFLANSSITGYSVSRCGERQGYRQTKLKPREFRNLKTVTLKQTAPIAPYSQANKDVGRDTAFRSTAENEFHHKRTNINSRVLDTNTVIARAAHLVNASPDSQRKTTMARNKAEKLLNIAQAKDISETIARAKLAQDAAKRDTVNAEQVANAALRNIRPYAPNFPATCPAFCTCPNCAR